MPTRQSKICFLGIVGSVLFLSEAFGTGASLSSNDLEYYKTQNVIFSKELGSYFDNEKPGYHSIERKNALYLVDALTHYPFPHDNCLKEMFLGRYEKALESIKETKVKTGAVVWNIYNLSYVVKTSEITVAFDLIRLPPSLRKEGDEDLHKNLAKKMVELCDILFVSHIHGDHADSFVAGEFLSQNKPVITPPGVFMKKDFYGSVIHWLADGKESKFVVPETDAEILVRIYPGHQAISDDAAVDNNFTVITLPNNITIAHSGDQSWNDDFKWLDTVYKDVNVDVLMVNSWTAFPNRVAAGLRPKIILPGHANEMSHPIESRIPFWKSYLLWQKSQDRVIHLFWGEPYRYDRK